MLAFVGAILQFADADAALLTDSAFDFGTLAITDNTNVSSMQILRSGKTTTAGDIYILKIGQPGVYTLTELPPFAIVGISAELPAYSSSQIVGTQQLTISAVDMAENLRVNENGTVQFKVGGVLQTSGAGGTYVGPATYQIRLNISITY